MRTSILCLVSLMLVFFACENQTPHQESQDHAHDGVSLKFTEYNTGYELFAEAEPMVAGHVSGILAHITNLETFKPLTQGTVTASLIIGTKGIRQKLEKPTRPGIYLFQLKPEVAGKGKIVLDIETTEGKSTFTINEIEVFADEHDAIHNAEESAIEYPGATAFTKEQSWKIGFATGFPTLEPFGEIIKTMARVQSAQNDEVILTAKSNGVIQFKINNLSRGTLVSTGSALFYVSGEAFADNNPQVRLAEAKNNFEKAEADYKRKSELAKDQLVSKRELINSQTEYENNKIIYENLKTNFSKGGQNVLSPKTGFVKHIYVTNGQYVEAGQPLVTITENKNLYLIAEVQQKFAGTLPFVKTANIKSIIDNSIYTLEELNGKVISFGKNLSDESYLIPLTLQIENRAGIVPGSFMEVFLKTETNTSALTIPNGALLEEQGKYSVFVQLNPESFEKREVKIGKTDGAKTEILSGLNVNDRIVTRGGILVKLASVSNSLDPHAGHVH